MFKKIDVKDLQLNPFNEIGTNWTLISAKNGGKINTMTASWGNWGVLWNKNVVTVYIRQSRYTKEFVDAGEYFTVSLFGGYKKELGVLGRKSGRDGDKIAEVEFHPVEVDGQPTFEESTFAFVCKKLHSADIPVDSLSDDIADAYYSDGDYHTMYIAEIVGAYKNEK